METPQVIYEDDYIIALNKPAGWVVNDSITAHGNPTLQEWLSKNFTYEISDNKLLRNGIVHRLDKPTSGVIMVAKTEGVFYALQKQFADRETEKEYIALVHGKIKNEEGVINAPVGRLPWKRTKFGVFEGGKSAMTKYKIVKSFDEYTLVDLYPKTGRTHQLRVHMKHIGHPIVSDNFYAGRKTYRSDIKIWPRLWLHAKKLTFTHPITKKEINIVAPRPPDLVFDTLI